MTKTKAQLIAENEALRAEIAALKAQIAQTAAPHVTYESFCTIFRDAYYDEKARQERRGVVCIYTRTMRDLMAYHAPVAVAAMYIARLKAEHKVFTIVERSEEMIRWAE
jgi:hypothetical protein